MGRRDIDSHMSGGTAPGHGSGPDCSPDKESTESTMENDHTMKGENIMENDHTMKGENIMENDQTIKAGGTRESSKLLPLFLTFLKIGAFTFGGGYAMIPLIQKEVVEKQKWISDQDILEIVAIAESTPGPIAINAATFVGYRTAGIAGAFLATLGVVLPSFFIILGISFVLRQFQEQKMVQYAFQGIRAGVLALIAKACFSMYKQSPKSGIAYGIMVTALICVAFFQVNVLLVIAGCACVGLISSILAERRHGT